MVSPTHHNFLVWS